ncbi:MAG: tRNA pseudouridine(38-40) synthase TruA [Acidobacteria bacterium]|nr:tRNA pseudouridine(38-40) synthase TruA [Acidobacteriota bacterium]
MSTWKITLEYDGTNYSGWQEQNNARTIVGVLKDTVEEILSAPVDFQGAGRTDAGVHALAQVAHMRVKMKRTIHPEQLLRQWNNDLPADIAILSIEAAGPRFHARHDASARSYVYQISQRKNAFSKRHVWWIKEPLDTRVMAEAATKIAGRHDFTCFRALDPSKPDDSPIVVVELCELEQHHDLILIRIEASHFLWRMVRRIVGVLVRLGKGEITMVDFDQLLNAECDPRLKVSEWTAPAAGLFLERVRY